MLVIYINTYKATVLPSIVQRHAECSQDGVDPAVPRRLETANIEPKLRGKNEQHSKDSGRMYLDARALVLLRR